MSHILNLYYLIMIVKNGTEDDNNNWDNIEWIDEEWDDFDWLIY